MPIEYQWIVNFGFAAAIAMYVLVRLDKTMHLLAKQMRLNSLLLARITGVDLARLERDFEVECNEHK